MSKLVIFAIFFVAASFVKAQDDPAEVCVGVDDGVLIGLGQDISCTSYYYCENEYGYEEDCASLDADGEQYEFNYETGQCDFDDVVNCASGGVVDPDPPITDAPPPTDPPATQPPATQPPATTQAPGSIPDVQCPTNRPGEIIFFESSNCTEYFICANGFQMRMACMEGFTWNQAEKQCDYPIFSRCSVSPPKLLSNMNKLIFFKII